MTSFGLPNSLSVANLQWFVEQNKTLQELTNLLTVSTITTINTSQYRITVHTFFYEYIPDATNDFMETIK